jgi:hypothetical protein
MCDSEGRRKTNTYEKDAKKHALTHQKATSTTLNLRCQIFTVTPSLVLQNFKCTCNDTFATPGKLKAHVMQYISLAGSQTRRRC